MRIISGTMRGRRFEAPEGIVTRPTSDRVKEAIFGRLHFLMRHSRILDIFSGSGNMAFEALSRGADFAVANDCDRKSKEIIERNARALGLNDRMEILQMDYQALIAKLVFRHDKFHFIFLDPPYGNGYVNESVDRILEGDLLLSGGQLIIEHSLQTNVIADRCEIDRRKYGKTQVSFVRKMDS